MDSIYLKSRAKINLTLDVLGKRDDGYHELVTVMQTLNLCDTICIRKVKKKTDEDIRLKLVCGKTWLPVNEKNTAYKAVKIIKEMYGITTPIRIDLKKVIPVSAGLAGGSGNAAAALFGMNKLFNLKIQRSRLAEIGKQIGADVPFCLMRGTALAEGIGERLTPLRPLPSCFVLVAKPGIRVSTANVFQRFDMSAVTHHPDTKKMLDAIACGNLREIAANLGNVLETVTIDDYPIIADIKETMMKFSALASLMSGSGPTVFGLFNNKQDAQVCMNELKSREMAREVFITTMFNTISK